MRGVRRSTWASLYKKRIQETRSERKEATCTPYDQSCSYENFCSAVATMPVTDAELAELRREKDEGFALRDQWLQDSRDQTAEAWATRSTEMDNTYGRNKELDQLWPQIHSKDAEISHLKEHVELLMKQLEQAEARAHRAEDCLRKVEDGELQPVALRDVIMEVFNHTEPQSREKPKS